MTIEELLAAPVAGVDVFDDPPGVTLFPEEELVLEGAADRRRREFATVRHCARTALGRIGVAPSAILPGSRGAPRWPRGVVGSMTHCDGYRAAAVAQAGSLLTIGIDAEPHARISPGAMRLIASSDDRARLRRLGQARPDVEWGRVLFSVKESLYKAWYPVTKRWLGFEDVAVDMEPFTGRFVAQVLAHEARRDPPELSTMTGRWVVGNGLVVSAVTVPHC